MMLSAVACQKADLTFASVHDSYWTHAAHVDTMNNILREAFVKLHSEDIMKRLRDEFVERYQGYKHIVTVKIKGQRELTKWKEWLVATGRTEEAQSITDKSRVRNVKVFLDIQIPPLPPKGEFDITKVKASRYFFH